MKHFLLCQGGSQKELYHMSFNGTHLQFIVNYDVWIKIIGLIGHGTPFAERCEGDFVPPVKNGVYWGFESCAHIVQTLDGSVSINIPAVSIKGDKDNIHGELRVYARTVELLTGLLYSLFEKQEKHDSNDNTQLFYVSTYVGEIKSSMISAVFLGIKIFC